MPEPLMLGWRIQQVTNAAHRQALGRTCPVYDVPLLPGEEESYFGEV
ncbi:MULTISPECIES: hypothetical protein [unclassified Micromonospora]